MTKFFLIVILLSPVLLIALLIWLVKMRRKKEAALLAAGELRILPFWKTIKESYKLAWKCRAEYLKISWLWLIISSIVIFLYSWLFWQKISLTTCLLAPHQFNLGFDAQALSFLLKVIVLACSASIAVAWHRLILRNEQVTSKHYLRFDKVVWNYFAIAALILLLQTAPILSSFLLNSGQLLSPSMAILYIASSILYLTILYYSARIVIILPAIALGASKISIKDVLQKTYGNFWKLFFAQTFCTLPLIPLIPVFLFFIKKFCENSIVGSFLYSANILLSIIIVAPIYLSFLSLAYKYLFEKEEN